MRARYIGDPRQTGHGPDILVMFGLSFPKGQWVNIDGNARAMRKIPNNNHFEIDKAAAPVAQKPKALKPESEASPAVKAEAPQAEAIPADWADAHHTKRIAWARKVSGGEVKTVAIADAILAAHFAPKDEVASVAKPEEDDGFSDLDPDV